MLTDPNRRSFFWKLGVTAAVLALSIGVSVFVAVRLAIARDGVTGGPARSYVTVAGTVTGVTGRATMRFAFHRRNVTTPLCAPAVDVMVNADRTFVAQVPLDSDAGTEALCPSNLFDGSDTEVDVSVNGMVVAPSVAINPVPYAHYASQYGTPDCPVGYERDMSESNIRFCRKCRGPSRFENCYDDVVRVGSGSSAFWVDRYEASVWSQRDGGTVGYGGSREGWPGTFLVTGQWYTSVVRDPPAYALSRPRVGPTNWVSWLRANEACAASGKRLPTSAEWLLAAQGTPSGVATSGLTGGCRTDPPDGMRFQAYTTSHPTCSSAWGAQDMVGNLSEWTSDWYASPNLAADAGVWPTRAGTTTAVSGLGNLPAAAIRGGSFLSGSTAGTLTIQLSDPPSSERIEVGFRCVIPR